MTDVLVRSVLGDERLAPINPGGGYPWYNCPFCSSPVYVGEANPEHSPDATPATGSLCGNPWCLANPAMPLDAARRIAQAAQQAADTEARRQRDQDAARRRIAEYAASQAAGRAAIVAEARRQGACEPCALKAWRHGREKYVHHRGQCPLTMQNRPHS